MHSGTSGFGVLVTLGNWPSGVICSGTGIGRKPCASSTSPAQKPPTAVQRREHDADLVELRRRDQALLAAQLDVRPVRRVIEEVDLARPHRVGPRQRA